MLELAIPSPFISTREASPFLTRTRSCDRYSGIESREASAKTQAWDKSERCSGSGGEGKLEQVHHVLLPVLDLGCRLLWLHCLFYGFFFFLLTVLILELHLMLSLILSSSSFNLMICCLQITYVLQILREKAQIIRFQLNHLKELLFMWLYFHCYDKHSK